MSDLTIRLAIHDDAEAVVRLWRDLAALHQDVDPAVWTLPPDAEERYRDYLAHMMEDPDRRLFVATRQDEVVGYLVAAKGERPPVLVPSARGLIQEICVAPSARRAGVGRRLVAEAMDWLRREGLPMAEAGYASANPMSGPFWQAQGFRPYRVTAARSLTAGAPRESAVLDGASYFASVAASYDRMQPVLAGPGYRSGLASVLDLIPHGGHDAFTCVELGCGTAALTHDLLARFPSARAIAVDSEAAMLDIARRKLAQFGERCEVRHADALTCDLPPCDIALSSFMFHHIAPERLERVLRRIATALAPGGCFILLDTMQAGPRWADRIGAMSRRLYQQHVSAAIASGAATQAEIDARWEFKRRMKAAGKDVEYRHTADEIMETMRAAGFDEVGLVWRVFASTIVVGFTPEKGDRSAPCC